MLVSKSNSMCWHKDDAKNDEEECQKSTLNPKVLLGHESNQAHYLGNALQLKKIF